MFFGSGSLVQGALVASGVPVRKIAQAAVVVLMAFMFLWPSAFQAGVTAFAERRAAQVNEMFFQPMLERLTEMGQVQPSGTPAPAAR